MASKAVPAVPVSVAPVSKKSKSKSKPNTHVVIITCDHLQDPREGFLLELPECLWYLGCRDCILKFGPGLLSPQLRAALGGSEAGA
jgi:hypothetical protein